jgi:hypothetical protein
MEGDFGRRSERWTEEKRGKRERKEREREEREMEGCTFEPHLPGKESREEELRRSGGETLTEERGAGGEETVRRLYYEETRKLRERREAERLRREREEDERFKEACTFRPELGGSSVHNLSHEHPANRASARYLEASTKASERRKMLVSQPRVASPGPGEYEEDPDPAASLAAGRDFDAMLAGFGASGFQLRSGAGGTEAKGWSFAPRTNDLRRGMDVARDYVKEDVVERLTRTGRPEHIRALARAAEEEAGGAALRGSARHNAGGSPGLGASARTKGEARQEFHEFLARQNQLQIRRKEKAAVLEASETPAFRPEICENSAAIHDHSNRGTFLQRVERDEQKRENL